MIKILSNSYSVCVSCFAFDVSRRLYHHFVANSQTINLQKLTEDTLLRSAIENGIKEFPKYGYRMMTKHLRRIGFLINNEVVNSKRVLRVMRENNLLCEIKKSFINTTDSNHDLTKYDNLIKKEKVAIDHLDQIWASDFTYIRLPEGFCYLAIILDAYSRKVIGYCLSKDMDTELVVEALQMAIRERRITNANQTIIHHSDQGVQYCSHEYTDLLKFHST